MNPHLLMRAVQMLMYVVGMFAVWKPVLAVILYFAN